MTGPRKFIEQGAKLAAVLAKSAGRFPGDEANFRSEAERALDDLVAEHGITLEKRLERTLATGRADAVFNRLIIEWEPPGGMAANELHRGNKHAVNQLQDYIDGLAEEERWELDRLAGVACDGHYMIFARYRARRWIVDEPVPVDDRSAEQLLETIVALQSGKALTAENLLREFGPQTALTRQLSRALYDQLNAAIGHFPDGQAARFYRQWETLFAVATGVVGEAERLKPEARRALAEVFRVRPSELDPARALFALQTYFAIVTKLIALLALSLYVDGVELDVEELAVASDDDLWEQLEELQHGAPFRRAGLANVVEPDVFGWYLHPTLTTPVRDGLRDLLHRLKEYDPKTLQVSPEDARDLLKDLYQGLLPRPVRHALGQYFTPDWLAEHLLRQVDYDGQPELRVVDPACGTGTFLVLAVAKLKERLRRDRVPEGEALAIVLRNIVGFDIDPLAVVAARTNYVLGLGSLVRAASASVDVPVYLADSIVMPAQGETLFTGDRLELPTAVGTFALPVCIDTGEELRAVCDLAARGVENSWSVEEFVEPAAALCAAKSSEDRDVLAEFFSQCLEQHRAGLDGLWPHVLRNAFMPAFIGKFDLVVGNPPWVNWESLPPAYRERTDPLWRRYGLFVHGGMEAMLGAGKKDVAMLMSYVATDKLLKDRGRLGFIITQTVFKTSGAGQGFRRFRIGDPGVPVHVEHVDDMEDLNPFVGASNRTAMFTWRKGRATKYPVPYLVWQRARGRGIAQGSTLDDVHDLVRPLDLVAAPVSESDATSSWLAAPKGLVAPLRKLAETGEPPYRAHAGVYSGANGVYWLSVDGSLDKSGRIPVSNLNTVGRTIVPKRYGRVESDLVHPLVRGSDIRRWAAVPSAHILFTQDPVTRSGIEAAAMAKEYPGALEFVSLFEGVLRARRGLRAVLGGGGPYWSMFGVGDYTLNPHKVVWKDQAAEFAAAVMPHGEPLPLPNHKVILIACDSDDEAHYLAGALNSLPVRVFVASYTVETQISTHVAKYIRIPKFTASDHAHTALAACSQSAHRAVVDGLEPDEPAVDRAAASLWGISNEELEAMQTHLTQLRKRDLLA